MPARNAFESGSISSCAAFGSATIILPVMNEVRSLQTTIAVIEQTSAADVGEYLFVVCARTTPESLEACQTYEREDPLRFRVLFQSRPFLGGAMRDAFEIVRGTHLVLMASDLETDPESVVHLIARSKERPEIIVTCSRWIGGATFAGYHPLKLGLNWAFQRFFSLLYGTRLTDMTFGFRIFPTPVVQAIRWDELRHPFLFESILKPLRLGVPVVEIPSSWTARTEGVSQNT
ncbi:MAG: glycosyltransferase family 2 protein, partial [Thermoanaerobaculia bacterium]